MKKTISNISITLGTLLIILAAFLFYQNMKVENTAKSSSENAVEELNKVIIDNQTDENGLWDEDEIFEAYNSDVHQALNIDEQLVVDGNAYLGVLTIPVLELELPIQSTWSYDKLRVSPCLYKTEPLVIAGHNYKVHFGKLPKLHLGDRVFITDTSGIQETYEVVEVLKVKETNLDVLVDEESDLILFTCNYKDNTQRIVVKCKKI